MTGYIDVHAHHYPAFYLDVCGRPDSGLERVIADGRVFLRQDGAVVMGSPWPAAPLEDRLATMDAAGVAMQVLSLSAPNVFRLPASLRPAVTRDLNDHFSALADEAPRRFAFLASLPLPDVDLAMAELDRALALEHAVGLAICTTIDRRPLDDPLFLPLWQELDRRRAVVFVHPTAGPGTDGLRAYGLSLTVGFLAETTNAVGRLVFAGIFERFPGIRWVFTHTGGSIPYVIHRFDTYSMQFEECRRNISRRPSEYLADLHYDTVCDSLPAMRCAFDVFPPSQFLFGTDYPHIPQGLTPFVDTLAGLQLGSEDHTAVASGNAEALLGVGG